MPARPAARPGRTRSWMAATLLFTAVAAPVAGTAEWRTLQRTTYCRDHDEFTAALARLHGESKWWWGVLDDGTAIVELHGSPDTGSWTLLRVEPSGYACALGAGDTGSGQFRQEGEQP